MRAVHHSSALDALAFDAARHGYSGSGIGWRSHRLVRDRRHARLTARAWWSILAAIVLVLVVAVAGVLR